MQSNYTNKPYYFINTYLCFAISLLYFSQQKPTANCKTKVQKRKTQWESKKYPW